MTSVGALTTELLADPDRSYDQVLRRLIRVGLQDLVATPLRMRMLLLPAAAVSAIRGPPAGRS
ncbi:hypothetical protein [Raineyella sp. LH-20]|uniref:hypothetical protein n=1 Tax=Raineyella sp. LH-20 TaxID=3081204 RepID=UPI0029547CE3|nr:hypothetical protein [Raineyella sp. LH-20]WOP18885.1 hypothetical protein R0146_01015 [Raineyella sp. LH-20]